jgi:hypothetical protein
MQSASSSSSSSSPLAASSSKPRLNPRSRTGKVNRSTSFQASLSSLLKPCTFIAPPRLALLTEEIANNDILENPHIKLKIVLLKRLCNLLLYSCLLFNEVISPFNGKDAGYSIMLSSIPNACEDFHKGDLSPRSKKKERISLLHKASTLALESLKINSNTLRPHSFEIAPKKKLFAIMKEKEKQYKRFALLLHSKHINNSTRLQFTEELQHQNECLYFFCLSLHKHLDTRCRAGEAFSKKQKTLIRSLIEIDKKLYLRYAGFSKLVEFKDYTYSMNVSVAITAIHAYLLPNVWSFLCLSKRYRKSESQPPLLL